MSDPATKNLMFRTIEEAITSSETIITAQRKMQTKLEYLYVLAWENILSLKSLVRYSKEPELTLKITWIKWDAQQEKTVAECSIIDVGRNEVLSIGDEFSFPIEHEDGLKNYSIIETPEGFPQLSA